MTKTQVLNFLRLFSLQTKVIIKFVPESEIGELYPCQVSLIEDRTCLLELSRKQFMYNKDQIYLRALLLHEIGHIVAAYLKIKSTSVEEFTAHKWAIDITKKRKYNRLHNELRAMLESWREYTWNEDKGAFRRYIQASKITRQDLHPIHLSCYELV